MSQNIPHHFYLFILFIYKAPTYSVADKLVNKMARLYYLQWLMLAAVFLFFHHLSSEMMCVV